MFFVIARGKSIFDGSIMNEFLFFEFAARMHVFQHQSQGCIKRFKPLFEED